MKYVIQVVKYVSVITLLLLFWGGCRFEKKTVELPQIKPGFLYSFEELSDSSLFSDVRAMRWCDTLLAFTDYYRSQLILCDDSGRVKNILGHKGKGPGEMVGAASFWWDGEQFYVLDDARRELDVFGEEDYTNSISVSRFGGVLNHVCEDSIVICSGYQEKGAVTVHDLRKDSCEYIGKTFHFKTPVQERVRNDRFVWKYGDILLTISNNIPVMEMFDLKNKTSLGQYDFSNLSFIKKNQEYIDKQPFDENSCYIIAMKHCVTSGCCYLLCSDWSDGYSLNQILVFDISDKKQIIPHAIYKLRGPVYRSFCVDEKNKRIFAANQKTSEIEVYALPE